MCTLLFGSLNNRLFYTFKKNKIKVIPDQRAQPNKNLRKHITVQKSRNLHRTFSGMFWIRGHQTSILGKPTLSRHVQKQNLVLCIMFKCIFSNKRKFWRISKPSHSDMQKASVSVRGSFDNYEAENLLTIFLWNYGPGPFKNQSLSGWKILKKKKVKSCAIFPSESVTANWFWTWKTGNAS